MAGTEKRRSTEQRNPVTIGVTATRDSIFDWRELGAQVSEILCCTHPDKYMIWNRRAYVGFRHLGVDDLPRFSYQVTGLRYQALCETAKQITAELRSAGIPDADLMTLD